MKHQIKSEIEKIREFFDALPDPVVIVNSKGKILEISKKVEEETGYERKELIDKNFMGINLFDLKTKLVLSKNLAKRIIGIKIDPYEIQIVTKYGQKKLFEINASKIEYDDKPADIVIFRSLKKRKELEERLQVSEERYRDLFENANDMIQSIAPDGSIIYVNDSWLRTLGYTQEEIPKLSLFQIIHPESQAHCMELFKRVMSGEVIDSVEAMFLTKQGKTIYVEGSVNCRIENNVPVATRAIFRDITERKHAEEMLQKSLKELERSNNELNDYTHIVAHDLKAPLRSIKAFCGLLLNKYSDGLDETGQDFLQRINASTDRMNQLIMDLLVLSRVGRKFTETKLIDLDELMEVIKQDLESQLQEKKGEIIVSKLPEINTQPVWMRQLFENLVGNALKFNDSSKPKVEVFCAENDAEYIFSVKDNGIGISEEDQGKLFKLFKRLHTEEEYPGTGAGLAICKKIVENFGGEIWIESKMGEGSTFKFTYPKQKINEDIMDIQFKMDQASIQVQANTV